MELKGVLAREMSLLHNRDILNIQHRRHHGRGRHDPGGYGPVGAIFRVWVAGTTRKVPGLSVSSVMSIIAPIAAMLIQMAISESGMPGGRNRGASGPQPRVPGPGVGKAVPGGDRVPINASPATAHMFIVNPLTGSSLMNLFSTHPPLEERVARACGPCAILRTGR